MLALPFAFSSMGWLLGSVLVVLCGVATNFGLYLIKQSELRIGKHCDSFYDMAMEVLPSFAWVFDSMIALKVGFARGVPC